jgi:hypothetical protein
VFKLGRKRPIARGPRFALKNYMKQSLPAPPEYVDYAPKAGPPLAQMYLNDTLGDCVIACMGHIEGVFAGNAGGPQMILPSKEIISLYSAIGGYVPGNPATDQGCDEQTALNYWAQKGLSGGKNKIAAWLSVDGGNPVEVRTALWLFENVMFGMELPDKWITPFPSKSGFTWDAAGAADPNNGHCVAGVGYKPSGVEIATWGMLGTITNAAIAKYATTPDQGELYTVISQDAIAKATAKAPNGFDWSQLIADFDSMGVK